MVNKVVPFDKLEEEVVEWCRTIMKRSPLAIPHDKTRAKC